MKGYPRWFNTFFISTIIVSLFLSGVLLIPGVLDVKLQVKIPWKLSGDMRVLNTAFHTLISFLSFFLLGSLWSIHMRREWRKRKNIVSGSILFFLFIILCLSALGLLYIGNEKLSLLASVSHTIFGVALIFMYGMHIFYKKE